MYADDTNITVVSKTGKEMENLYNRLKVELGRKNEIVYYRTVRKSILRLVELQSLVAKCRKIQKI